MKICIDTRWVSRNNSGVGCYITELAKALNQKTLPYDIFLFGENIVPYSKIQTIILSGIKKRIFQFMWKTFGIPSLEVFTGEMDLFHFTNLTNIPNKAKRNIVTVHDLAFKKLPLTIENKNLSFLEKKASQSIKKASHIIAVSNATKKDIMQYYNIASDKISVIYHGMDLDFLKSPSEAKNMKIKNKYSLNKPFLLSVSTLEPRKNFETLIHSYAKLNKSIIDEYDLVIVGQNGWSDEKKKLEAIIQHYKLTQKVKLLGFVDREELKSIYNLAKIYLHTSLYEGFGMSLLDAMAYKLPIIASDVSCHREILDKAALYYDLMNAQDLALKIELLLIDNDRYTDLSDKSQKRLKIFSWDKAAEQTAEVYKKVMLAYR